LCGGKRGEKITESKKGFQGGPRRGDTRIKGHETRTASCRIKKGETSGADVQKACSSLAEEKKKGVGKKKRKR